VRRWLALSAGMLGVLVVLRPGTGTFHPEGLYRVASAAFWALGTILTRRMTATERPATTMFWSAVSGLVVLSVIIPFHLVRPSGMQVSLSVVQGVLSSLGQWLVILSLRHAPVSTLAPLSYTQLLWMTLAGALVFGVLPDGWTLLGAAVIVTSGLYTAWRERRGGDARVAETAAFRQPAGVPDGREATPC
jgi:drug/metabolite transporter (DMT)-like permease